MADFTSWLSLLGLVALIGIFLWKFGSLQKTVGDIDSHVKMVTDPALISLRTTVDLMNTDFKTASAPIQSLSPIVANVDKVVKDLTGGISTISQQAEKIATLGQKYDEIEKLVKHTDSILAGPSTKGKAGEEILGYIMGPLEEMGLVRADVPIGGGKVEYAALFDDGKILPIDSKVVSTDDLATLRDQNTSEAERTKLESKIRTAVRERMGVVQKYIDPDKTVRLALVALPDSLMDVANELIPEAIKRNVILTSYSAVPRLIQYFVRIHGMYAIKEDITALMTRISKAQQEVSALDDKFFQSSFENPVRKLGSGVNAVKRALSEITDALTIRREAPALESFEATSNEEQKERPIPARA